jgi:hypothetical protein
MWRCCAFFVCLTCHSCWLLSNVCHPQGLHLCMRFCFYRRRLPCSNEYLHLSVGWSLHCDHVGTNKRLVFEDVDHQAKTKSKKQEPKFTPLTVSSRSSTEFLSMSSPSSMSAVSKSLYVLSTISNVNKRLVLDDVDHRMKTKPKKQEPTLAAYDIDWFDSSAIKNECLKYTHITNLPDTQEGQITFLLSKFETTVIKTAFTDAVGKVGKAARTVFYPLPPRKEKLIKGFLELISGKNSIMVDHSKDSFR